ncbi:hypothetical protein DO97_09530 [Neosynechococcus sphagnicola sy1]|uniref:PD-(D/E)XK endonuclease-like domain-containing protein n=1 Tax=Neosynechococcus sphagnicola sy1 TaxID=1497020 RepID=A0A098TJI6_9CYAN|nr:PD-(D/E)XK nuclease family protein [Neosynechococcus sphagnicola]KGF72331.1 hypothetical protein DO97_09530 [Neosynechococcus sphagnicola sy1]
MAAISTPPLMRLSQGHLNVLADCPRKFQYLYLDHLGSPISSEQHDRQTSGSRFHLLMQQRALGLPIEPLTAGDPQLHQWLNAFVLAEAEILGSAETTAPNLPGSLTPWRQSEYPRSLYWQDFWLTIICDLLIADGQQAQILDWKTYPRPQQHRWLANNWQTRLYPFVLTETSPYTPEQISMTYWFFDTMSVEGATPSPQSLTFAYNTALHQQTRQDLTTLLNQLRGWLRNYEQAQPFPQVALSTGQCPSCPFACRCQRSSQPATAFQATKIPDLAQIPEIAL